MEALRFVVGDLAGFRAVAASAEARTLELAGGRDDAATAPRAVIRADPFVSPSDGTVGRLYAEQFLWARYRTRPPPGVAARLFESGGGRYVELRAEKTDEGSHAVTDIAFFVRYDESGAFEIACTAPPPMASALIERCRTLALSVRPKS